MPQNLNTLFLGTPNPVLISFRVVSGHLFQLLPFLFLSRFPLTSVKPATTPAMHGHWHRVHKEGSDTLACMAAWCSVTL